MEEINELLTNENIDLIEENGKSIYLVGTAHVSQKSVELATLAINTIRPDSVAIELCEKRYESIKDPDKWKKTDIVAIIRKGQAYVLFAQLILAGFQKKLGKHLKVKPGAEMLAAANVANENGAEITFADRDVKTTLKRTWANLSFFSMIKVIGAMLGGLFSKEEISEEELERLKTSDVMDEMLKEFSKELPEVQASLIDERDKYLAQKIRSSPGVNIVAVVGAGHCPGIKKYITDDIILDELEEIPEKSFVRKMLPWLIPAIFLGLITYGFTKAGADTGIEMLSTWVWINAVFGGIGALIALAHPLAVISAFLVSPFSSLNPFLAAGWVAGLVQAIIKKPRVEDLETIGDDISTFKGFFSNRVLHILLIMILTNILGSIGTFISLGKIFSLS